MNTWKSNNEHKKAGCRNTSQTITDHGSYLRNCLPPASQIGLKENVFSAKWIAKMRRILKCKTTVRINFISYLTNSMKRKLGSSRHFSDTHQKLVISVWVLVAVPSCYYLVTWDVIYLIQFNPLIKFSIPLSPPTLDSTIKHFHEIDIEKWKCGYSKMCAWAPT